MSIKKIMHKDRYGAQVSIEFGEGGAASQLVEQFLGGMGVPAMQDIPQQHPGGPKGTDTVPAWLTPGEFVMNAEATRMFEPQIEEMNNAGRAVQRQQGGSIPEYKSYGGSIPEYYNVGGAAGSWVNEDVLDALLMTESGGDFNAVSSAGARGGYQIMPRTAKYPGYGVTSISPEEVLDPMKSREFARQYLVGLAKQYPERTPQEILQMYNAGAGRVINANALNPLSQETIDYPGKIEAEMERMAKLAAANGSIDDDYDIPLDYNTVPVPAAKVTMKSLRSPTSDEDVLTSLKSTAASIPEEEDALDKILSSGKDVGQWIMDNKADAALMGLTFVPGLGVVAMAARGLSLANKLNSARKGKVAFDAITKSQKIVNKPHFKLGPKSASMDSVPRIVQKTSPLRQANAGAATLGATGMGLNSDLLGDRADIVNARSTDTMLAYNAGEREKLIAGLESGDLRPDYVKKALADLDKRDAKFKKATDNVSIMDFNKTKDDLETKAQLLFDAGYVDEGNALLAQVPPPPMSDGVAPLTPSQAAAGMVAPVRDLPMTTEQVDKNVEDRKAAALKEIETTITTGGYTEDSVKKYRKSGNPEDLVDLEDESMFSKAKNFFKTGFDTVIDKGALGEAATLYLGSRALGYDHEGSLDFVTQRYSKGIEDKLANANKAIGSYTPKSIEAYRLSGDMNDLEEITTTKNLNERVGWVDRRTGDVKRLNKYEDGKGNIFYVDGKGKVVDTSGMTMKKHYDEDRNNYEDQLRPVVKGEVDFYVSTLDEDDRENAAAKFNQEAIVAATADYATQNGYETAEITYQMPNIMAGIAEYYSAGAAKQRKKRGEGEEGVQDLVRTIINNSVNKPLADDRAMNLNKSGDPVDLNVASEQALVGIKGIADFDDDEQKAQLLQSIYEIAWKPLSLNEKQKYEDRAREGSNGFYTFIQMRGHVPTQQQWIRHMEQKYGMDT